MGQSISLKKINKSKKNEDKVKKQVKIKKNQSQ